MGERKDKSCGTCAFAEAEDACFFPDPTDGSDPPMFVQAAMPDPRDDGKNCVHYRERKQGGGNE